MVHVRCDARLLGVLVVVLGPTSSRAADCNRNGIEDALDVAPWRYGFASPVYRALARNEPTFFDRFTVGDLDGDGDQDRVELTGPPRIRILLNRGDDVFEERHVVEVFAGLSAELQGVQIADFDADGLRDIAITIPGRERFQALIHTRLIGTSLDCDRDGTPDECQTAATTLECDASALPRECARDCDRTGRSDACEIAEGLARDCNGNGIPDDCERSRPDCNENGIPDLCEASGEPLPRGQDIDGNAVPDDCEGTLRLTYYAPEVVAVEPGRTARVETNVLLHTEGLLPGDGVAGWNLFFRAAGADVVGWTWDGTTGAVEGEDPAGFYRHGFRVLELTCRCPEGYRGAVGAIVFSLEAPVSLPPAGGPHKLVKLIVEGVGSEVPGHAEECVLDLVREDNCNPCHRGQPINNAVTTAANGATVRPVRHDPRIIRFLTPAFRRGDANGDGRVDISDAIRTFMFLFLGAADLRCLDAGDSTDDGRVDLSDGIHTLNDFFREGTEISSPGPFGCGLDPTADELGCEGYPSCG